MILCLIFWALLPRTALCHTRSPTEILFHLMDKIDCELFLRKNTFHELPGAFMDLDEFTDVQTIARPKSTAPLLNSGYRTDQLWPKGLIPIRLDPMTPGQIKRVACALNFFHTNTTIRFVRKQRTDTDYVLLSTNETGLCYSEVLGKKGGKQLVNIGSYVRACWTHGGIIHELLHVVGLFHEQSRDDRDKYVTVHWANIPSHWHDQFMKNVQLGLSYKPLGPYDFGSVMHYPRESFMRPSMSAKVEPIDENNKLMGNRKMPTKLDIWKIDALYSELQACNAGPIPSHKDDAFVQKPPVISQPQHSSILILDGSLPVEIYHPTDPGQSDFIQTNQESFFSDLCQTWLVAGGLIGNEIYAAGASGASSCAPLNLLQTHIYDVTEKAWRLGPKLNRPRGGATGGIYQGKLLICGGVYFNEFNSTVTQKSCEILDPKKQTFGVFPSMLEERYLAAAAEHSGFYFILGGKPSPISSWTRSVQKYNPDTSQWHYVKDMDALITGISASAYKNHIVACGSSRGGVAVCQKYDVISDQWEDMEAFRNPRRQFSMLPFNGKLYALMGLNGWDSVESYDETEAKWKNEPPTKTRRFGFLAVAV